jgi:hypothetical protein
MKIIKEADDVYVDECGNVGQSPQGKSITHMYEPFISNTGYQRVGLTKNGLNKKYLIHRLVAMYYVNNKNPKKYNIVNHLDGNKLNNHYSNLEWCTHKQNMQHAKKLGLFKTIKTKG